MKTPESIKGKRRYQIKRKNNILKVWDTKENKAITKELPSMEVANEIADDFNKMENKDFTPLGLPDFSKFSRDRSNF